MKINTKLKIMCVTSVLSLAIAQSSFAAPGSKPIPFTISSPSAVPGAKLEPGQYTIQILSRLSDRDLLKVASADGAVTSTFLGVEDAKLPHKQGSFEWQNSVDGTQYLRGYNFPGGSSPVEFVYPKDDAVKIATANPAKVLAVDPASEGKPADNTISRSDMELLNLWLLRLDKVGSDGGGIQAERYAQASAPKSRPVIASLPHTASLMPLVWFMTPLLLFAAGLLRVTRVTSARKRDAAAGTL